MRDGGARIIYSTVEMHEQKFVKEIMSDQCTELCVKVTKSGRSSGPLRIKGSRLLLSIDKYVVLSLLETRMIVPPYQATRNVCQAVVGCSQVPNMLVSVSIRCAKLKI